MISGGKFHRSTGASSVSHFEFGVAVGIRGGGVEGAQRDSHSHDRAAAETIGRDAEKDSGNQLATEARPNLSRREAQGAGG